MGFFKNIINFLKKNKDFNISFKNNKTLLNIEHNFIAPFVENRVDLENNKNIIFIDNNYILFNSLNLNFKNNEIIDFYEENKENIEFYYPKKEKLKNFIYNYFTYIEGKDKSLLKFDIDEDYKCYSNILYLIKKYNLNYILDLLEILKNITWIRNIGYLQFGNIEIEIEGSYSEKYIYSIIETSNSQKIGKNKNEYILIDLVNNDIQIGRII